MRGLLVACAVVLGLSGCAAARQSNDDHAVHHPAGSAGAPAACSPGQMKMMQDMHHKMMSAKTPQERQALMAEHMKSMPDGNLMMCGMESGGMTMGRSGGDGPEDMMKRCMEMCGMMDRGATQAPAAR